MLFALIGRQTTPHTVPLTRLVRVNQALNRHRTTKAHVFYGLAQRPVLILILVKQYIGIHLLIGAFSMNNPIFLLLGDISFFTLKN